MRFRFRFWGWLPEICLFGSVMSFECLADCRSSWFFEFRRVPIVDNYYFNLDCRSSLFFEFRRVPIVDNYYFNLDCRSSWFFEFRRVPIVDNYYFNLVFDPLNAAIDVCTIAAALCIHQTQTKIQMGEFRILLPLLLIRSTQPGPSLSFPLLPHPSWRWKFLQRAPKARSCHVPNTKQSVRSWLNWSPLTPGNLGLNLNFSHPNCTLYTFFPFPTHKQGNWTEDTERQLKSQHLGQSLGLANKNKGVCHTVALPFTLKRISRQKKNYGNSNMQKCNLQKTSSKRNPKSFKRL